MRQPQTIPQEIIEGDAELLAVFINPSMTSRAMRPLRLMVPPEILRLVTMERTSFSDALVCSGMYGCSSTLSSSAFRRWRRKSNLSSAVRPVRCANTLSNLRRNPEINCGEGCCFQTFSALQKRQTRSRGVVTSGSCVADISSCSRRPAWIQDKAWLATRN